MFRLTGFLLAYCLLAAGSISFMQSDGIGIPIWPAAGVGVGALLLLGTRALVVPFVGGVFAALYRDVPIAYALLTGIGVVASAKCCVWLLDHRFKFDKRFRHSSDVWGLACAAILSSALFSNFNLVAYGFAGILPWTQYISVWMHWWSGDALGVLMVTPLILSWSAAGGEADASPLNMTRLRLYGLILAAVAISLFYPFGIIRSLEEASMLLMFPPLVCAVLRFPLREVTASLVLIGALVIMALPLNQATPANIHQMTFFLWLASLMGLSVYVMAAQNRRIVAELRDSHEQLNALLETLPDGIGLKDADGRWLVANRAALDFFGLQNKDWRGKTSHEIASYDPLLYSAFKAGPEHDRRVMEAGGALYVYEEHVECPDGVARDFEVRKFPRFTPDGAPSGLVVIGRDVTEEKQLRLQIEKQEQKYRLMLQTTGDGFWLLDLQGRLLEVNPAYAELSGYSMEELFGMQVKDLDVMERAEDVANHIEKVVRNVTDIFETKHRRKDGQVWEVEVHASYLPVNTGYIVAFLRDISRRKLAEQALLESNEQLTTLIETIPDAFFLKDGAGRWQVANGTGLGLFRLNGKAWKGKTDAELAAGVPELGPAFEACIASDEAAYRNGTLMLNEERILGEGGSWRDFEIRKLPRFAPDGSRAGLVVIGRDITEQKITRLALESSNARNREQVRVLQTVLDALPAEVGLLDKDGNLVTVNRNWVHHCEGHCDLLSIVGPGDAPLKICPQKLGLSTDVGKKVQEGILGVLQGQAQQFVYEYPMDFPKRNRWYKLIVSPIASANGPEGAVVMNMDTTQARNAEEVVRWREQQFRAMTENSPDMIARVDVAGNILYANRALATYLQGDAKSVLNTNIIEFCPTNVARVQWREAVEKIVRERRARVDVVFEFDGEQENRVFQAYVVPESGKDGQQVASLLVVIRDVTELRRSEYRLRESRSQLRRLAAENEAVREKEKKDIARELHDEMGQLLNALRMDIGLVRMQYGHLSNDMIQKTERMLDVLDRAIVSMRTVVAHLRPTVLDMGLVPALEWLRDDFMKIFGIDCYLDVQGTIPALEDEQVTAIFRIVQESLTNAAKHAKARSVRIGIRLDGALLRLIVGDDGCGFDPDGVNGAHQHFGLLGMRERALALNGVLEVISAPGNGSNVMLSIPVRYRGDQ